MDLTVSPDIEAFGAYLIVLLVGLFAAVRQVHKRLENLDGIWLVGDTWILFGSYLAVPLVLFWLLDRTQAINDTSLFAALLVGIGYERILAGNDGTLTAPDGVSGYWSPFLTYANRVSEKIRDAAMRADRRLQRALVREVLADGEKLKTLEALARTLSPDVASLDETLADIEGNASLGKAARAERRAEALYDEVRSSDDYLFELKQKGLCERAWFLREYGGWGAALALLVLIGGPAAWMTWQAENTSGRLAVDYAIWRLEKPNASAHDLWRARVRLGARLQDPALADYAFERLTERLGAPEPDLARIDALLKLALVHRCAAWRLDVDLPALLSAALAAENADVRARLQRQLVYLSEPLDDAIPVELAAWSPAEGDSIIDVHRRMNDWLKFWADQDAVRWRECSSPRAEEAALSSSGDPL